MDPKFIVAIVVVIILLLLWKNTPSPPSPPPSPPKNVCDNYLKYGPSSIKDLSLPGQYTCPNSKIPDYCYLPFDQAVELCLSDKKCVGILVGGDKKYAQLINVYPTNYGVKTPLIYYEKKI